MNRLAVVLVMCGWLLAGAVAPLWADDDDDTTDEHDPAVNPTPTPTPAPTPETVEPAPGTLKKAKKIVPDPVLREKIRAGLAATRRADLQGIAFEVQGGVVTMSGRVKTLQDRSLAEAVARTLPGVAEVKSKITLASGFRPPVAEKDPRLLTQIAIDEAIRKELLRRLAKITGLRLSQLQVEVYGQVAVIGGTVPTPLHIERVRHTVKFTRDLRSMVIQLQAEKEDE